MRQSGRADGHGGRLVVQLSSERPGPIAMVIDPIREARLKRCHTSEFSGRTSPIQM